MKRTPSPCKILEFGVMKKQKINILKYMNTNSTEVKCTRECCLLVAFHHCMQTSHSVGLNHKRSEKKKEGKMAFLSFTCLLYGSGHCLCRAACVCAWVRAGNHAGKTPDTVAHSLVESTMSEGVVSIVGLGSSAVVLESTGRNSAMAETKHKALTEKCVASRLSMQPRKAFCHSPLESQKSWAQRPPDRLLAHRMRQPPAGVILSFVPPVARTEGVRFITCSSPPSPAGSVCCHRGRPSAHGPSVL